MQQRRLFFFLLNAAGIGYAADMDNEANTGKIDGDDETLTDRRARSERGSIESEIDTNRDTNTQTEDIDNRSNLGVGE